MNLPDLIKLIKDNIKLNKNGNIKHLYTILNDYNGIDWKKYKVIDETKYNKIFLDGNDEFEIYIITWNNYQQSKIHDHPNNGCIYKILDGHLVEENYDKKLRLTGFKSLFKNSIGYTDNNTGLHKMINYKNIVAVSLHIYSPPNHNTTYYDIGRDPLN